MLILGQKLSASRMNYSGMSLRRCIEEKPDVADDSLMSSIGARTIPHRTQIKF
jgi:hypothetical protein